MATLSTKIIEAAPRLFLPIAGVSVVATLAGVSLAGSAVTIGACLAMLVLGLPHGTLDLELIASRRAQARGGILAVLTLYLVCAAAMLTLWQFGAVAALAVFVLIAIWHFAEDWEGADQPLLEVGGALALLAAPALFNRPALDAAFVALTGSASGAIIADALLLVAPVAIVLATVLVVIHWQAGRRDQAVGLAVAVVSMTILPPILGFALYFCLLHSPRHFSGALCALSWTRVGQWLSVVAPLTLAALGLSALIFRFELRATINDQIIAASFMTLAVVTVPHMLVPRLVDMFDAARRLRRGPAKTLRLEVPRPL